MGERLYDEHDALFRGDLQPSVQDPALFVDHEVAPDDAHVLLAVHRLLLPDAVPLGDGVVGVGQEREGQLPLFLELRVARLAVRTDAEHHRPHFLDSGEGVAEAARLLGATGRVVLRIEVENHLPAEKVAEADLLPAVASGREGRCFLSGFQSDLGHLSAPMRRARAV